MTVARLESGQEQPLTEFELACWKGLYSVEAAEKEHAEKVARSRRSSGRARR